MINEQYVKPADAVPVIIHVVSGKKNYISGNHIVAVTGAEETPDDQAGSCFSMQVDALLSVMESEELDVTAVLVEKEAIRNTVLDSGSEEQVVMDRGMNAFRATPAAGVSITGNMEA